MQRVLDAEKVADLDPTERTLNFAGMRLIEDRARDCPGFDGMTFW